MHFIQGYVLGANLGVEYGRSRKWLPECQLKPREGGLQGYLITINLNHEEDKSMPINLKRSFIIAAMITVLIGSGAAIADVKVGFLGGFSGPLKSWTPSIYKAAKLAVKHVNDQGGVLDNQKILLPNADTTCADTVAAAQAAARLVKDENVVALVGAICSGATIAVAKQVAIPGGITLVSPASTSATPGRETVRVTSSSGLAKWPGTSKRRDWPGKTQGSRQQRVGP